MCMCVQYVFVSVCQFEFPCSSTFFSANLLLEDHLGPVFKHTNTEKGLLARTVTPSMKWVAFKLQTYKFFFIDYSYMDGLNKGSTATYFLPPKALPQFYREDQGHCKNKKSVLNFKLRIMTFFPQNSDSRNYEI